MKHLLAIAVFIAFSIAPVIAQETKSDAKAETKSEGITVTDAKLGTDVKEKEIVGEDSSFALASKVWLWLKVTGGSNENLTATWKSGEYSKETKLEVGGSPWRTWTAKNVSKAGDWTVTVADSKGNSLKELSFKVK